MAGEQEGSEGCLSLPGQFGVVKRPKYVTVRATNRHGKEFEMNGTDLLARAFCHEIEHLDGKLFIDSAEYMLEEDDE
jgi:peptide deformylase